jgi:hypothetical protein
MILSGDTSGTVTVTVPAVAGTNTITLPAVTGTAVISGQNSAITAGTAASPASGTSVDFTGIPSWVKRITVMFSAVSTNGNSGIRVQLGYGATPTYFTTAYDSYGVSAAGATLSSSSATDGFLMGMTTAAAQSNWGSLVITNINATTWTYTATFSSNLTNAGFAAGSRSMSGNVLTAIRVTTAGGTDVFDNGTINILYE